MALYVVDHVFRITGPFRNKMRRNPLICEHGYVAVTNIMDSYKFNSGGFTYSDHLISKPFRIEKEKSINRFSHLEAEWLCL